MKNEENIKEENKELDRYERIVDRAHKEIESVRTVYKTLAWIIGTIITVGIACITFLTYNTIHEMRSDLTDQLTKEVRARIEEEFEQPAIKATVQEVAAERASFLMTKQIAPEVTKFKAEITSVSKEVEQIETLISDAKIAIDEVRTISNFSLLLINASNDDRDSLDALHKIADMDNNKFQEIADRSVMQIFTSLEATDRLEIIVHWKEYYNLDPVSASLTEFINVFNKCEIICRPTLLKAIWEQERFPKVERLDFLQKTIATTQSLRTLNRACRLINKEAKIDKNFFSSDLYLKWWEENREKYNENPESQPADSPDKK
ncbi:MAG TPA: hypothetical protein ENH94_09080 [Phycisphaerales bacterium]|nr:hypothetical protein [Phycisphaerales bacterium]